MHSDPQRLSEYHYAGTVATEDHAYEIEKQLYCHGIPLRTEVVEGEVRLYTFERYLKLLTAVIVDYNQGKFIIEEQALKALMMGKIDSDAYGSLDRKLRRQKLRSGVMLRLVMVAFVIIMLMMLFKRI